MVCFIFRKVSSLDAVVAVSLDTDSVVQKTDAFVSRIQLK